MFMYVFLQKILPLDLFQLFDICCDFMLLKDIPLIEKKAQRVPMASRKRFVFGGALSGLRG